MPLAKTKDHVSETRCTEILDAARKVFAYQGFDQATVNDVAEAAGVAKGTVYLYFNSKREVYLAALEQGILKVHEQTARNVEEADTVRGKLRAFIATRVRYFEEYRDFFKIYHSEFGNILRHPTNIGQNFKDHYREQASLLESILCDAADQGEIRCARTDLTAFTIYDMTRGLITQRLLGWSRGNVDEDIEFLFDLIWRGISKESCA